MTIASDFDFDADPREPTYPLQVVRMFAMNKNLAADHHRLFRAIEVYDRKFGEPSNVDALSIIMGESMERVLEIAKEIEEMSAAMNVLFTPAARAVDGCLKARISGCET